MMQVCLYKTPESFKNIWNYQLLGKEDIKKFQYKIIKEMEESGNDN